MPQNFLITGMPKTGKTVLLREIIDELKRRGLKVGGFISPEETHHGTRTAFHVIDVETGREAVLASVDGDGPKVSKYHVDIRSFETVVVPCMQQFDEYDVFVVDEIGRMEMKSRKFSWLLDKLLESDTPFIATVHRDYAGRYGPYGELFTLRGNNRERVYARIIRKAEKGILAKKKVKKKRKAPKKAKKKAKKPARKRPLKKKPKPERKERPKKNPTRPKKKEKPPGKKLKKKGILDSVRELLGV